jgi:hypothetical protein
MPGSERGAGDHVGHTFISETNRIRLVLFGMHNITYGPYLTAIRRILTSVMVGETNPVKRIGKTDRVQLVLFGTQNRTCGPYLTAINRSLISVVVGHRRIEFNGEVAKRSFL